MSRAPLGASFVASPLPRPSVAPVMTTVSVTQLDALDHLGVGDLALEGVAGPAGPRSLRIAALDHEVLDHAVEDQPVVEAVAGELAEVVDGLRGVRIEQLERDLAVVGGHGR